MTLSNHQQTVNMHVHQRTCTALAVSRQASNERIGCCMHGQEPPVDGRRGHSRTGTVLTLSGATRFVSPGTCVNLNNATHCSPAKFHLFPKLSFNREGKDCGSGNFVKTVPFYDR
jgi:hypothetical protein